MDFGEIVDSFQSQRIEYLLVAFDEKNAGAVDHLYRHVKVLLYVPQAILESPYCEPSLVRRLGTFQMVIRTLW